MNIFLFLKNHKLLSLSVAYSKLEGVMTNELQNQIDNMSKSIKTDSYQMSIGELAALYKD